MIWFDLISHHMLQVYMLICVIFHCIAYQHIASPNVPAASAASAASLSIPAAPRAEKPHHAVKGVLVLENPTAVLQWLDNFWGHYQTVHVFNLRMLVIFRRRLEITNISCGMDPEQIPLCWRVAPCCLFDFVIHANIHAWSVRYRTSCRAICPLIIKDVWLERIFRQSHYPHFTSKSSNLNDRFSSKLWLILGYPRMDGQHYEEPICGNGTKSCLGIPSLSTCIHMFISNKTKNGFMMFYVILDLTIQTPLSDWLSICHYWDCQS